MADHDLGNGEQLLSDEEDVQVGVASSDANGWNNGEPEKPDYVSIRSIRSATKKKKRTLPCIGGCWKMPPYPTIGLADVKDPNFGRLFGAEYVGTLFLVFIGTMSVVCSAQNPLSEIRYYVHKDRTNVSFRAFVNEGGPQPITVHVALAFGIVIASMAQALGHISGAHLNPAVSFGLLTAGKCSLLKALCYTVAQCLGGLNGALFTWLLTKNIRMNTLLGFADPDTGEHVTHRPGLEGPDIDNDFPNWGMGASTLALGVKQFPDGVLTEVLLTFFLVFVICAVSDDLRKDIKGSAPLAIGLAAFASHAAGITLTGSSLNPARSFGPAIFSHAAHRWSHHWVYWIGPILGGLMAGFIYTAFFNERPSKSEGK